MRQCFGARIYPRPSKRAPERRTAPLCALILVDDLVTEDGVKRSFCASPLVLGRLV